MKRKLVFVTLMFAVLPAFLEVAAQDDSASGKGAAKPSVEAPSKKKPISVLLYFGVYTQWYRIEESLEPIRGHKLRISNARTSGEKAGRRFAVWGADFIPAPEEASTFDVIVLSDVDYGALKEAGLAVIDTFVKEGGALLVLGGPFTYGEGKYDGTIFPQILPVIIKPFDLKWERAGLSFSAACKHPILTDLDLSAGPQVYWIHEARPKEGSVVVLEAGTRPLLVLGTHGKGRVAAFLGTPMGVAPEGKLPFWQWQGWDRLMRRTLLWLAGDK